MERVWMKIGEAAKRVGVSPKDLRYWESIIPEIQPRRSRGNLRYYHVDELDRLHRIHGWIREGLTVGDCRELLLRGQLTRGLDFGMEEEPLLVLPAKPVAKGQPLVARRAPEKAKVPDPAKAPELGKVRDALKRLLAQLG